MSINPGNQTAHGGDWKGVETGTKWLTKAGPDGAAAAQPFFFYDGMVIVHPPYHTDQAHWDKIPADKIKAPAWPALDDEDKVHPCDLQMTMKKGCAFTELHADDPSGGLLALNSSQHKIGVRRAYYAMINEFDDMNDVAQEFSDKWQLDPQSHSMLLEHLFEQYQSAFGNRLPIFISY